MKEKLTILTMIICIIAILLAVPETEPWIEKTEPESDLPIPVKSEVGKELGTSWEEKPVLAEGKFKSYMDGECISDVTSEAFSQKEKMQVNHNGLYSEGQYVGIAMSQSYGDIGDKFRITLSSGTVFFGIMTDLKQDRHIDETLADKENGSVIEFIVDTESVPEAVRITGSLDCIYEGVILKIERLVN